MSTHKDRNEVMWGILYAVAALGLFSNWFVPQFGWLFGVEPAWKQELEIKAEERRQKRAARDEEARLKDIEEFRSFMSRHAIVPTKIRRDYERAWRKGHERSYGKLRFPPLIPERSYGKLRFPPLIP